MHSVKPSSIPFNSIASLLVGTVLAAVFIGELASVPQQSVRELTLGQILPNTEASGEDKCPCLCIDLDNGDCVSCAESWAGATVLWLGNSQLPTIVDRQPGDRTAPELLHAELLKHGIYVVAFAPPNANLQEHYVLCEYLIPRIRPKILLLPVCFDDLRETGVRDSLGKVFDDPAAVARLSSNSLGQQLLQESSDNMPTPASSPVQSTQDRTEASLNALIDRTVPSWQHRGTARSLVFLRLHFLRNTVFGITADSIRRMIPARRERNMNALEELLKLADRYKTHTVIYLPPIRNDVPLPYDLEEYGLFKTELEQLARQRGAIFANFENEVSTSEWGQKGSPSLGGGLELDFMHFKVGGHRQLSAAMSQLVQSQPWFKDEFLDANTD